MKLLAACVCVCLSVCAHGFLGPNISKRVKGSGSNGQPIGNGTWRIERSRNR